MFCAAPRPALASLLFGDGPPHAIPVSYGYDAVETTFYFRLAVGPDSRKDDVEGRPVSFVVHGQEGGNWRSVVAEGRLERTTDEAIATETLQGLDRVRIPLFDVFHRRPRSRSSSTVSSPTN